MAYRYALNTGDLFVVTKPFCDIVTTAAKNLPDSLMFESKWMQAPQGWCYLATPFLLPQLKDMEKKRIRMAYGMEDKEVHPPRLWLRAFHWDYIPEGPRKGQWQVLIFGDVQHVDAHGERVNGGSMTLFPEGFFPLSYMSFKEAETCGEKVERFEHVSTHKEIQFGSGNYVEGDDSWRHEIRWVYAALHLMAQKIATNLIEPTDRHTRRRAEREGQTAPPYIKVVTLRRLEQDRKKDPSGEAPDWKWQWVVEGHWRHQFYPSEGVHRDIFIERFIKGPPDKPLKDPGIKLFSASR